MGYKSMKIVIGSESFIPNISGVSVHAELLAQNLAKSGHKVFVFAPSDSYKTYRDNKTADYTIIRIKSVPNPFRKGFRFGFLPQGDVSREIDKIKPDLVHLQDPTSICTALLKTATSRKIPIVVTNHFSLGYVISYLPFLKPFHGVIKKILQSHLTKFYNKCDYIFCPTETVKADLMKWNITKPIQAISNGVDLERFFSYSSPDAIRLEYHLPINPIVLYVGRMNVDKNLETIISAIPYVLKKINAHFLFVGGGDDLPKIIKQAKKLDVERQVTFLGPVPHDSEDLPQIYQVASIFAIASTIETQSIVTLEAMASGLPMVAANSGALPELVKDGVNGFLFPAKDPEIMADKIIKILLNDKLALNMKKAALTSVSKHQIQDCLALIENKYKEICGDIKK